MGFPFFQILAKPSELSYLKAGVYRGVLLFNLVRHTRVKEVNVADSDPMNEDGK